MADWMRTAVSRRFGACTVALVLGLAGMGAVKANYDMESCDSSYSTAFGQAGTSFLLGGDDVSSVISLPFSFEFYGEASSDFRVNMNGFVIPIDSAIRSFGNTTLPTPYAGSAMYPFWDDLDADFLVNPDTGVFTRVDGAAPNRVFTIEWHEVGRFNHISPSSDITFQVRLFEGTNVVQFEYLDVFFGGGHANFDQGQSATVGMEGPLNDPRVFSLYSFNTASLSDGQCIRFTPTQETEPPPAIEPISIPTMNVWGLLLFSVLLAWVTARRFRSGKL